MARRGNSVFGIDLGKHVFKGVLLQKKGDERFVLTSYASREVPAEINTPEELAQQLKLLFKDLGGSAKGCAIAVSDPASLLRIIEQPDTPIDLLRNALRLNGLAVLNQECKDFVLDCAPVLAEATNGHAANGTESNHPRDHETHELHEKIPRQKVWKAHNSYWVSFLEFVLSQRSAIMKRNSRSEFLAC